MADRVPGGVDESDTGRSDADHGVAASGGEAASRRGARAARQAERARRRRSRRIILIAVLVPVVLVVAVGGYGLLSGSWSPGGATASSSPSASDFAGAGTGEAIDVTIPDGATAEQMASILVESGVVASADAFVAAYHANPNAQSIGPNTYTLQKGQSAANAVMALLDPASAAKARITVTDGQSATKVFDRISSVLGVPLADVQAAAADPAALGIPADAVAATDGCTPDGCRVDGWLYPATYTVDPGASAKDVLTKMVTATTTELTTKGVAPADWQRVLTLASIVQVEVTSAPDMPKVAQVLDNRLAKGWELASDATAMYAAGKAQTDMTSDDWDKNGSPYNTRVVQGLPPGPIDNPGEAAIGAVLQPTDGPWMYYLVVNPLTGEIKYATTAAEFDQLKSELNANKCANWEQIYKTPKPAECG